MVEKIEPHFSIVITGAPATGKTILYHALLEALVIKAAPAHMTRAPRDGEVDGVDGTFVSEEEFERNFSDGKYLEDSLDFARFNGNYYGSPVEWVERANQGERICMMSCSTAIARQVRTQTEGNMLWVHLKASEEVRRKRLLERTPDMGEEEIQNRLNGGDSQGDAEGSDRTIDTSNLTPEQVLQAVIEGITKR